MIESNSEKERLYLETMKLISTGRARLVRQGVEFEQLATDLQTRLDDKELKSSEIAESFREFKAEITGKAENSRTGLPISKRLLTQLEAGRTMIYLFQIFHPCEE